MELVRVHRQSGESGIPQVSRLIREGQVPLLRDFCGPKSGVSILRSSREQMDVAISDAAAELGGIGDDLRILSPVKGGPAGVDALNLLFHRMVAVGRPIRRFLVGEPVIYLRNDYRRDLRNGSLGKVTAAEDRAVEVQFDVGLQEIGGSDLDNLQLAYALTVHKSQGSQFNRVIIPLVRSQLTDRSLLYTAVTRAVSQVVLVGDPDVLRFAVEKMPSAERREVGLGPRLRSNE